ncbi:MAG: leucine-rich repeat protein, partial [Clostridia bacterium]|nr:leucine-rich repeat protein [Clostridia bacterium]
NPESDFSFTYDSSTQTYKIGLSNKDVEGIVVLPKEYDNVQTSIDYYGSDEMSYFEFNNEVNLCLQSGVLIIPEQAFLGVANLKSITIPDSVTSIGDYAFYYCDGLTSVIIPDSVTNIGYSAFHSCDGLTSVTIGDSVTSIGDDAFYYCDGLISITIGDNVTSIGNSVFYGCSGLTSVIIPDSVTSIGRYAFYGCSGLTGSLIMPDSVTSIGNFAFNGCSGLTGSLIMPDSVTSIGSAAFEYCSGLTSVIIPNSVKSIGNEAFSSCSGLASVYIPSSVATISASSDYSAPFNGCSSSLVIYTDVANASSKPSGWGTYWNYYDSGKQLEVVYGCSLDNEGNIVVPPATINFYVDDVYHSSITKPRTNYTVVESDMPLDYESCCGYFLDDIYMTTIKNNTINLLSGEVNLYTRTARVPTGTTFVEGTNNDYYINFPISANTEPMFAPKTKTLIYATNNVVIPKYYNGKPVTKSNSVSSRAFKIGGTVTLNDEFTEIVDMAFARGEIAASITGITIPDTVTRIGKGAFTRCGYMGNVIIPNVNLTIDESAFYECSAVESFYIPSSVSIIAPSVMENVPFYLCSSAIIYTDVANSSSIPSSWDTYWNYYDTNAQLTVMYGYTLEMYLQEISSSATVIDNNITDENKIQICKKMTINNPLSAEFIGSELGERKYDNIELSSVIGDNQTENSYLNEVILEKKECYILPKKQVVA